MSETLIQRIKDLEDELEQLKSQLQHTNADHTETCPSPNETPSSSKKGKKAVRERPFDFSSHPRRHVALRMAYLGWVYQGFAVQENTDNTVEARLFEALLKTRLIQDRQSSNYHRCGRTDKGVSAFSQFGRGLGVMLPDGGGTKKKDADSAPSELPYVKMLNRVLPQDIRILDWAPAAEGFSARFDCQARTYRYYFPRGSLDIMLMADAAKRYEGTHDFRNLCKMDVGNGVLQFERTILSAAIKPVHPEHTADPYDLFIFELKGLAFLYHQVRCMMAVLLLIGQKLEAPEIINELLNVQNNPRKPQYSMAVDYPLVLYDCHFEGLIWRREAEELNHALSSLQQHWTQSAVKAHVVHGMIQGLEEATGGVLSNFCWLVEGSRQRNYRPLLERPRCESLESRIDHFVKRGRLELEEGENGREKMVHKGKRSKHSHNSLSSPVEVPNTSPV
ncbi:tRNA pseudouridine(38/39) synthase isoform X2 [Dunckerocampus dactyliophorus]|uniref:tRNA pseudouridine(38/39) synthase isoform X2 n=1 Tax=Dunckerocampus dactyliophorus TaxID=161453 RepID=UPI002404F14E|nr:tRNA pseudouridine(38/39) synthase isoform X2 [Dunckerocampus dactyliophorus]